MDLKKRYAEVGVPLGEKADEDKLPYIHEVEGQVPYTSKHRAPGPEVTDPKEGLHSSIYKISEVQYKERPMTWWGPTPDEARALKVKENKFLYDKTTTLSDAVKRFIRPGINLGVCGFVNTRNPFAICWQIVKEALCNKTIQATDLTLSYQSQSLDVEWLLGAQMLDSSRIEVKRVELAWQAFEVIGSGPIWTHMVQNGMIEVDDYTNYGMSARFKCGAMGIPFIPVRDHGGSDMEVVNRGVMLKCPFTGRNVYVLPACHPDVAIGHVTAADMYGNCRIFGFLNTCPEIIGAATAAIVTCENLISTDEIRKYPNLTEIPFPAVSTVTQQTFGGYPGAVWGNYWFDMDHFREWRAVGLELRLKGNIDPLKKYYDENFYSCDTFDDFLAKRGYKKLAELKRLDMGQAVII